MKRTGLTEENQRVRATGVGASESSILFGVNPYETIFGLWRRKMGQPKPVIRHSEAMRWGLIHEPSIAQAYSDYTGNTVRKQSRTFRHKKNGRMVCTPDYKVVGHKINVQCKTARTGHGWGTEWTSEVPEMYLIQVQHEMEVLGHSVTHIPVLVSGSEFKIYEVKRNRAAGRTISEEICAFWKCVETGEPPEPASINDLKQIVPKMDSLKKASEKDVLNWLHIHKLKLEIAQLNLLKDDAEDALKASLGDDEALVDGEGRVLVTWRGYERKGMPYRIFGVKK